MTTNNKNNASQTLFRFVSLRNPQLTETKDKNLGFIHRSEGLSGTFDTAVAAEISNTAAIKFGLMEKEAGVFAALAIKSESAIESDPIYQNALKLGRKIAKREVLSSAEELQAVSAFENTDKTALEKLWNNLIYQVITQQDFYVKEAVIHVLKALHFGFVCKLQPTDEYTKINGNDLKIKALDAKVVLPASLFGDSNNSTGTSSNNSFQVSTSYVGKGIIGDAELSAPIQHLLKTEGEKISELSLLESERKAFSKLRSELEEIQKMFYKLRSKAYEKAYREYIARYQPAIDLYNEALNRIEAQIKDTMTQAEIDALYANLGESTVPPFVFEYKNELNFRDLQEKLSLDSFAQFIEHFTLINYGRPLETELNYAQLEIVSDREILISKIPVSITDEYDTFSEVYEQLNQQILSKTEISLEKAPVREQEFARIGSILIPVNKTTYSEISGTYFLNVITRVTSLAPKNYLSFYYNTDSAALGLMSASAELASNGENYLQNISAIDVMDGKVIFPIVEGNLKTVSSVRVILYFKNGESAIITHESIISGQSYTGRFVFKTKTDEPTEGGENPGQGQGNGTNGTGSGTFTPKRFGVRRLGIADYLKVEQSVHAYVPGEVSNIENVMASELRHKSSVSRDYSEITDTTSESVESEKISDTTKAERNEMQTEVAKEIEKQQSFEGSTRASGGAGSWTLEVAASYANNTAQHDSTRQAVAKSQEITERAMERVLTKINKERVQKIIKEYTETNVHEFDNRGKVTDTNNPDAAQPKHITGVYRWVDKKMKNQIYDYGKRTMFEFMIPEPAKLHRLATFATKEIFKAPVDPRKSKDQWEMANPKSATDGQVQYWANYYGVTLTKLPESNILYTAETGPQNLDNSAAPRTLSLTIPDNYKGYEANITYAFYNRFKKNSSPLVIDNLQGGFLPTFINSNKEGWLRSNYTITGINVVGNYAMQYAGGNGTTEMSFIVKIKCTLSDAFMASWKEENFDAIIKAYEAAYAEFLVKQKEAEEKAKEEEAENGEKLGNFYREMESVILKHNCIAYLLQDYLNILGKKFTNGTEMKDFSVTLSGDLDQYAALAKFMEQAFEWSIMDYTFYPYYWANRDEWQKMYLSESADPLFRNFLQAGMARVIVTVKPGFEDAVQFFMTTGRIWNGGEVPVIGDPMYMSIVDELRQPTGKPQGKYWITRIPTILTILQAESVGLKVDPDQPLPIFPEDDPKNCENPKELESGTSFIKENISLANPENKETTLG